MAVTITQPASRVVPRGTTRIAWSATYPYNAYEVQFRPVSTPTWSSAGRKSGNPGYVDWNTSALLDGVEYCFRVVLYATSATSGTTIYNGHEASPAYSIIVTPKSKIAKLRMQMGKSAETMMEVPMWGESNNPSLSKIALNDGKVAIVPLVNYSEQGASELKIDCPDGSRALGRVEVNSFKNLGIPGETYEQKDTCNTYYRYYYSYGYGYYYMGNYLTNYTRLYSTYNRGNYLTGYTAKYDKTYYRGYYTYTGSSVTGYYRYSYNDRYYYSYTGWDSGTYKDTCTRYYYTGGQTVTGYTKYSYSYVTGIYYYGGHFYYATCSYTKDRYYWYPAGNMYKFERYIAGYYTCYSGYTGGSQGKNYSTKYGYTTYTYKAESFKVGEQYTCYKSYSYPTGTEYSWSTGTVYGYKTYTYAGTAYAQYYGYYRYTYSLYAPYYGYYQYDRPNYSPYYNYYRYTENPRQTLYSYTRSYHYA